MAISLPKMSGSVGCLLFVGLVLVVGSVSSAKFEELFQPSWATDHFVYEGELLKLKLDNYSGSLIKKNKQKIKPFLFSMYNINRDVKKNLKKFCS